MDLRLIKQQLDALPWGERKQFVSAVAESAGCSADSIYRRLRKQYGKQKTAKREAVINDEWIDAVAKIKAESLRYGRNSRELSTMRCIRILERAGTVPKGVLNVSSVNRRLANRGIRFRKAAVRYEAEFANQAHQIDFSRSEYCEVIDYDARRGDYVVMINQKGLFYKNKDGKKQRLWVAQVMDEYSRIRIVKYFASANESALLGLQMLNHVWTREADEHPFRYVPYFLRSDNGSFATSEFAKSMFSRLDIGWKPSAVGNSRSMGKVERGWRSWWQWELETAMVLGEKNTIYLSDLNKYAMDECIRELTEKHPTRAGYRGDLYLRSLASSAQKQRELDLEVIDLASRVVERRVGIDCRIRFKNTFYLAPQKYAGRNIRIVLSPHGKLIGEAIDLGERFELDVHEPLAFGEYASYPETYVEKMGKAFDREALGIDASQIGDISAKNERKNVLYLPPNAETVAAETPFDISGNDSFQSIGAAKAYIGRRLGKAFNDLELADEFEQLLTLTLDKKMIDGILRKAE